MTTCLLSLRLSQSGSPSPSLSNPNSYPSFNQVFPGIKPPGLKHHHAQSKTPTLLNQLLLFTKSFQRPTVSRSLWSSSSPTPQRPYQHHQQVSLLPQRLLLLHYTYFSPARAGTWKPGHQENLPESSPPPPIGPHTSGERLIGRHTSQHEGPWLAEAKGGLGG